MHDQFFISLFVSLLFESVCLGNPKSWNEEIKCNGTCRELFCIVVLGIISQNTK